MYVHRVEKAETPLWVSACRDTFYRTLGIGTEGRGCDH